jgi:putative membrane protein
MFRCGNHHRSGARKPLTVGAVAAIWFAAPNRAWADAGGAIPPQEILRAWNDDPVLWLSLCLLSWLYGRGFRNQAGCGGKASPVVYRRALAFAGGMLAVLVALVSPLDLLSDQLSSAHMVQHLLLMMVAAPLFVLGAAGRTLFSGLPRIWRKGIGVWQRRPIGRRVSALGWHPLFAWSVQAFVLWIWHIPRLYEAALEHPAVHDVQHLTFFFSALLFWRVLLDPAFRWRLNWGAGVLYLFTTSLHTMALGVLMALSPSVWYPGFEERSLAWGLTALEDQQLAGFLMWMPAGMMYGLIAAILFALGLQETKSPELPAAVHIPT